MKTKNLTISLDSDLLNAGKRYAKLKGTSLTQLFRDFLIDHVVGKVSSNLTEDFMTALDQAEGDSKGKGWKREDAYS